MIGVRFPFREALPTVVAIVLQECGLSGDRLIFWQKLTVGAYNICMEVEWDPNKAVINREKHGVRFSDAEAEDEACEGEQRFIAIGLDHLLRVLFVVFTYRGENIRLISARPATRYERRQYESGI